MARKAMPIFRIALAFSAPFAIHLNCVGFLAVSWTSPINFLAVFREEIQTALV